jgi:predicted Zn-dependent protease
MPDMFRQMFDAHKYSERPPEFLLTHPVTENRISDAAGRVDNLNTSGFKDSLDYQLMRTALQVQYQKESHNQTSYERLIAKSASLQQKQIAHYGLALILFDHKKYKQALTQAQILLAIDGSKISYLTLKHLIDFEAGHPKQALKALTDLIEINPGNHSLIVTYATLLAKDKQFKLAADELKKHSRIRPSDPSVWQKLSEYESKAKNELGMLQAHAEFLFLTGQKKQALNQLKRALELSKGEYLTSARIEQRAREIDSTNNDMSF